MGVLSVSGSGTRDNPLLEATLSSVCEKGVPVAQTKVDPACMIIDKPYCVKCDMCKCPFSLSFFQSFDQSASSFAELIFTSLIYERLLFHSQFRHSRGFRHAESCPG